MGVGVVFAGAVVAIFFDRGVRREFFEPHFVVVEQAVLGVVDEDAGATSADWNAAKPDPAFFRVLLDTVAWDAEEIVYVGDRLDNDLKPAKSAGMRTAFIRRGPWGRILERHPDMQSAVDWRIETLAELPAIVEGVNSSVR